MHKKLPIALCLVLAGVFVFSLEVYAKDATDWKVPPAVIDGNNDASFKQQKPSTIQNTTNGQLNNKGIYYTPQRLDTNTTNNTWDKAKYDMGRPYHTAAESAALTSQSHFATPSTWQQLISFLATLFTGVKQTLLSFSITTVSKAWSMVKSFIKVGTVSIFTTVGKFVKSTLSTVVRTITNIIVKTVKVIAALFKSIAAFTFKLLLTTGSTAGTPDLSCRKHTAWFPVQTQATPANS